MTLSALFGPIAAATILNVFLFAGYWRASQVERRTGKEPWIFGPLLVVYLLTLGALPGHPRTMISWGLGARA